MQEKKFHRHSVDGVEAVFERMWEAVGRPYTGYALAFDVSENDIKNWRRRGRVSRQYLEGFALEHGVSLDWLLHGEQPEAAQAEAHQVNQDVRPYGVSGSQALQSFVKQISAWSANGQLQDEDLTVLSGMAARLAGPEPAVVVPPAPRPKPEVPKGAPMPKRTRLVNRPASTDASKKKKDGET